jgi:hypothetical protein
VRKNVRSILESSPSRRSLAIAALSLALVPAAPATTTIPLDPDDTPPTIEVLAPPPLSEWQGKETWLRATWRDHWLSWFTRIEARLDGDSHILTGCLDEHRLDCSLPLEPGRHRLEIEVVDRGGCKTTVEHEFEIYDPATDVEPPVLEFLAPYRDERKVGLEHDLTLRIADPEPGSGLDPRGFALEIGGRDVTASCSIAAGLVSCRGVRLEEGEHLAVARVRERMGNVGRASRPFSSRIWQGPWRSGLKLELVSPRRLLASTAAEVPIELRFADDGSGIAEGSLRVSVRNENISASCVRKAEGAECRAKTAADGWYWIGARVENWEGGEAQLSERFYRLSGKDDIPPTLELLEPAEGGMVESNWPLLRFRLDDRGSALDDWNFDIEVDGIRTFCLARPEVACRPIQRLSPGRHRWKAALADMAGNRTEAAGSFEVSSAVADKTAPEMLLGRGVIREGREPGLQVRFSDAHSGVNAESIEVMVDGQEITDACEAKVHGVVCPGPFSGGSHRAEVTVADAEGNWSAASFAFEYLPVAADLTPPFLELTTLSGAPVGGEITSRGAAFCFTYGDGESGSEQELISLEVAGRNVSCFDLDHQGSAVCRAGNLPTGPAKVEAKVKDLAGNLKTATATAYLRAAEPTLPAPILTSGAPDALLRLLKAALPAEDWLSRQKVGLVYGGALDGDQQPIDDCLRGLDEDPPRCELPSLASGRHRLTLNVAGGKAGSEKEVLDFEVVRDP